MDGPILTRPYIFTLYPNFKNLTKMLAEFLFRYKRLYVECFHTGSLDSKPDETKLLCIRS